MTVDLTIALLRRAQALVDTGVEEFMCHALDEDASGGDEVEIAKRLRHHIRIELQGNGTFSNWLFDRLVERFDRGYAHQICHRQQPANVQLRAMARSAWIDKMIHNLETKGTLA